MANRNGRSVSKFQRIRIPFETHLQLKKISTALGKSIEEYANEALLQKMRHDKPLAAQEFR